MLFRVELMLPALISRIQKLIASFFISMQIILYISTTCFSCFKSNDALMHFIPVRDPISKLDILMYVHLNLIVLMCSAKPIDAVFIMYSVSSLSPITEEGHFECPNVQ